MPNNYDPHGDHLPLLREAVENLIQNHRYNDAWALLNVEVAQIFNRTTDTQRVWAEVLQRLASNQAAVIAELHHLKFGDDQ